MYPHSLEAGRPSAGGDRTSLSEACALGLQMAPSQQDCSLTTHVLAVYVFMGTSPLHSCDPVILCGFWNKQQN